MEDPVPLFSKLNLDITSASVATDDTTGAIPKIPLRRTYGILRKLGVVNHMMPAIIFPYAPMYRDVFRPFLSYILPATIAIGTRIKPNPVPKSPY